MREDVRFMGKKRSLAKLGKALSLWIEVGCKDMWRYVYEMNLPIYRGELIT